MSQPSATLARTTPAVSLPRALIYGLAALTLGAGLPMIIGSPLLLTLMTQAAISSILALAVGTLMRFNGAVSFGHAAFYGIAAYIVGLSIKDGWMSAELAIPLALLIPAIVAFLLGLAIVDIPGIAFSMLTLAVGQAFYEFAMKARDVTNGEDGFSFSLPPSIFGLNASVFQRPQTMFLICWATLVLVVFALHMVSKSRFGRLADAIRENEERARFIGYKTKVPRAMVLALSGFIAALGGVLSTLYNAFVSPDTLHWSLSGSALIMVIIGGPKLLWGPAFGAIIFFFFKDIAGNLTEHWPAMIGVTLIVVTVLLPLGIGGTLAHHFGRLRIGRGA